MAEDKEVKVEGTPVPPQQVPQTPEQQMLNAFNTTLNLVVRELNILYGNVQGILNQPKQ